MEVGGVGVTEQLNVQVERFRWVYGGQRNTDVQMELEMGGKSEMNYDRMLRANVNPKAKKSAQRTSEQNFFFVDETPLDSGHRYEFAGLCILMGAQNMSELLIGHLMCKQLVWWWWYGTNSSRSEKMTKTKWELGG